MKRFVMKLIAEILSIILCLSVASVAVAAEEPVVESEEKIITSVELHNVKYYAAVKTQEEVANAAFFVDFVVYFDDGTTAQFNSDHGWDGENISYDVSWCIKEENEENFGEQQSLYIAVDGEEYWAGYVSVEVNQWKALLRTVVTWDWVTKEMVETAGIVALWLHIAHQLSEIFLGTVIIKVISSILASSIIPA